MRTDHPLPSLFERLLVPSEAERLALSALSFHEEGLLAGDAVAWTGDRRGRVGLVLEGMLATSKVTAEGRVQVTGFHIPGDVPDLPGLLLDRQDADVVALVNSRMAWFGREALGALLEAQPRLARALWRLSLVEASISREWVVNVGRRDATSRVAHLLCEMMARMEAAGLTEGNACRLGLTQRDLSEATALSVVHVNRVMQELRGRGLVTFGQGRLVLHDREGLAAAGDFRPDYLHLPETAGRAG